MGKEIEVCIVCGKILELDDEDETCKRYKELQKNLEMDDLASNILYSSFNPGL